jgi:hypothetical protein
MKYSLSHPSHGPTYFSSHIHIGTFPLSGTQRLSSPDHWHSIYRDSITFSPIAFVIICSMVLESYLFLCVQGLGERVKGNGNYSFKALKFTILHCSSTSWFVTLPIDTVVEVDVSRRTGLWNGMSSTILVSGVCQTTP